ncbi:hypothetical protein [Burkholderia vietnamiensis]|nr:hypothetical protein [Burkholderia vietnamiensis]
MIKLTQGFDSEAFDPPRPEAFVDSTYNQLLLCASNIGARIEESDPV